MYLVSKQKPVCVRLAIWTMLYCFLGFFCVSSHSSEVNSSGAKDYCHVLVINMTTPAMPEATTLKLYSNTSRTKQSHHDLQVHQLNTSTKPLIACGNDLLGKLMLHGNSLPTYFVVPSCDCDKHKSVDAQSACLRIFFKIGDTLCLPEAIASDAAMLTERPVVLELNSQLYYTPVPIDGCSNHLEVQTLTRLFNEYFASYRKFFGYLFLAFAVTSFYIDVQWITSLTTTCIAWLCLRYRLPVPQ